MSSTPVPARLRVQPRVSALELPSTPAAAYVSTSPRRLDPALALEREELLDAVRHDMDHSAAVDPAQAQAWQQLLAAVRGTL